MNTEYLQKRWQSKVTGATLSPKKEPKAIKPISDKRKAKLEAEKSEDGTDKQKFFDRVRPLMVGVCQCGCGEPSQKKDDMYFRHSVAHIYPQRLFPSVQFHPLNWVERGFWSGCHGSMDNKSMKLWPNMADWMDIKAKVLRLDLLLTDEEKATKFYRTLKELIEAE